MSKTAQQAQSYLESVKANPVALAQELCFDGEGAWQQKAAVKIVAEVFAQAEAVRGVNGRPAFWQAVQDGWKEIVKVCKRHVKSGGYDSSVVESAAFWFSFFTGAPPDSFYYDA